MDFEDERQYSAADVARITGRSPHTVAKWLDSGALRSVRPAKGGRRVVRRGDLKEFFRSMQFDEKRAIRALSNSDD